MPNHTQANANNIVSTSTLEAEQDLIEKYKELNDKCDAVINKIKGRKKIKQK
jgi:hypothetical protein